MTRVAFFLSLLATPLAAQTDAPVTATAPSGFDVTLIETLVEQAPYSGETLVVLRFVAPAIASPVLSANLQPDMEWACREWGLPRAAQLPVQADRIVVEFMAERVTRGESAPEIRQFFESYSPLDGACVWELY